jgi:hypothetical protein
MSFGPSRVRRSVFDVGRSAFVLFNRHELHPAFRTISWMVGYDFGMHQAGIPLDLLLLLLLLLVLLVLGVRATAVSCSYLGESYKH